jgi:hypothetical protein
MVHCVHRYRSVKYPGIAAIVLYCAGSLPAQTANPTEPTRPAERERVLLDRIESLEKRLAALEAKLATPPEAVSSGVLGAGATGAAAAPLTPSTAPAADKRTPVLSFVPGTTLSLYLDGYYGYNFNRPVGRANLLRANDVLSNNLTLNQLGLILERAPDIAAERWFGGRVDLMFGQNTETLQGGTQNEPRPQVYRSLFQAYGTYVFPVGTGLTVDFGKFYSAFGFENNYAYDEINYSRSFYFNYLPFYHMGFRTTYSVNDMLTLQHWLVNGANQTEDFNGFKSNAFLLTIKPTKTVSWNVNYYFGQESRDLVPAYNPVAPTIPTQPGLSVTPTPGPKLNGRSHIIDTYASWSPSQKVTFAGEFDHVVSRLLKNGPASHVLGGAAYAQYRFTPRFVLAGRFEYLRDHGGLFSGITQDLKEHTVTATYQPAEGMQLRFEYRRDFSNRFFFLTDVADILKKEQNTATVGMVWWFGGKSESW